MDITLKIQSESQSAPTCFDVFKPTSSESLFSYTPKLQYKLNYKINKINKLMATLAYMRKTFPQNEVNTSKYVGILYDTDIIVNILCIGWSK